jgi:hypothetical protein
VSADIDALDRGVIEAGLTAAEALSRVAALERQVAALALAGHATGRPAITPAAAAAIRPDLHLVEEDGQ